MNHNQHRKVVRRSTNRRQERKEKELRRLDQTEVTVATPEEIRQEQLLQRQRLVHWVADGTIYQRGERIRAIASKRGLL